MLVMVMVMVVVMMVVVMMMIIIIIIIIIIMRGQGSPILYIKTPDRPPLRLLLGIRLYKTCNMTIPSTNFITIAITLTITITIYITITTGVREINAHM